MLEHIGTKWNPRIDSISELEGKTHLGFESAWSAPESLLRRLHELSGWKIVNRHDDPDAEHDPVMTCEGGSCNTEYLPGTTTCSHCEDRIERDLLDDDYGECPTCFMNRADYLVTVEADWPAKINIAERQSTDLYGDVVLGIVSAHSKEQAMRFVLHRIPEKARQDEAWYTAPQDCGMAAFRLHAEDEKGG
jgi:hypothetical protein